MGALHDGRLISYNASVLDAVPSYPGSSAVPPLYGLIQLAGDNASFRSKIGRMYCLPDGFSVDRAEWPAGIRTLQCERAPGGH